MNITGGPYNGQLKQDGSEVSSDNPVPIQLTDEQINLLKPSDLQVTYNAITQTQESDVGAAEDVKLLPVGGQDLGSGRYRALTFSGNDAKVTDTGNQLELLNIKNKLPTLGTQDPINSSPVVFARQTSVSRADTAPAIGLNLLNGANTTTAWYDTSGFSGFTASLVSTTVSGTVVFEQTNDNLSTTGVALFGQNDNAVNGFAISSINLSTTTQNISFPLKYRFVRMRMSVAATGTVSSKFYFNMQPYTHNNTYVTSGTLSSVSTITTVTAANLASTATTDIGGATITTSPANLNANVANNQCVTFCYNVSAASGTNKTLDLVIAESVDGTNVRPIYHFERITAVGNYVSPPLKLSGTLIQYQRTVGGSSPSFTQNLVRVSRAGDGRIVRNFFDRVLTGNAIATGTVFNVDGCNTLKVVQSSTADGTGAATFTLRGSEDGQNFFDLGTVSTTIGTDTTTMTKITDINCKFVRVDCTTAGTANVMNYLNIRGQE